METLRTCKTALQSEEEMRFHDSQLGTVRPQDTQEGENLQQSRSWDTYIE